jgi:hypothetical protein
MARGAPIPRHPAPEVTSPYACPAHVVIGAYPAHVVVGAKSPWGPYKDENDAIGWSWMNVGNVAVDWSEAARQIALAIGYAESRFGVTPDWQFDDGRPSYNWGAMVASADMIARGEFLEHADHDAKGTPVRYRFGAHPSASDGIARWVRLLPKDAVAAAQVGDARGVAAAMYRAHWYTGTAGTDADRIAAYAKMIHGAAAHTTKALGIASLVKLEGASPPPPAPPPSPPPSPPPPASSSGVGGAVVAAALFAAVFIVPKFMGRAWP